MPRPSTPHSTPRLDPVALLRTALWASLTALLLAACSVAPAAGGDGGGDGDGIDVIDDGDAASAPGLFAQFRATSGAPLRFEGLPFNDEGDPFDVRGLQLSDTLGEPDDPGDWVAFTLVHGEAPTTTIDVALECSNDATPSPIRVVLRDADGDQVGLTTVCDQARSIAVPNEGGAGDYVLHVIAQVTDPFVTTYVLSVDAYCFGGCSYELYEP